METNSDCELISLSPERFYNYFHPFVHIISSIIIMALSINLGQINEFYHTTLMFIIYIRPKRIEWITECLSTSFSLMINRECLSTSFSVMINSYLTGIFRSPRGLRQTDSISLFLFLL